MSLIERRRLWKCPRCGQTFVTRNLWHSCTSFTVDQFFRRATPRHKKLYRAFLKLVRRCGPLRVNINKTRISFQARVRFAGVARLTRQGLVGQFWLKRRIDSPRFVRVEFLRPNNYIYQFRIHSEDDLNLEVLSWMRQSYEVGRQQT